MASCRLCISVTGLVLSAMLAGCGTLGWQHSRQEDQFTAGLQALQAGDVRTSQALFEQVVTASPLPGITDEALFRLALLQLAEEGVAKGAPRTQALLGRLRHEYQTSRWSPQAAALQDWLGSIKAGRDREREQIHHLLRENRELRQNIERLKSLELEIEKKRKR